MDSKPAVFREIAATLKSAILKGNFHDGTPFPTEHELSARFQVTRTTVRRALELLVQEGLVLKGQGRRIQVTLKPLTRTSWNFSSFSEGMRAMNDVPSSRVDAAECLDTPEGPVFHLVRTRGIVRGRDVQYLTREDSTVPLSIFPGIYEHDFAAESLYEVMRRDYGIYPCRGFSTLKAVAADESVARDFRVSAGTPLIEATQQITDASDRVIETVIITYAPELKIRIARDAGH